MSVPVPVEELSQTVERYGQSAYLLTTSEDGRPHATDVALSVDGAIISCDVGRRTARNGIDRPLVSLVWPPVEPGGYSLIVDGDAAVEGTPGEDARMLVSATNAVLHRPAPIEGAEDAACGSDCVQVEIPE